RRVAGSLRRLGEGSYPALPGAGGMCQTGGIEQAAGQRAASPLYSTSARGRVRHPDIGLYPLPVSAPGVAATVTQPRPSCGYRRGGRTAIARQTGGARRVGRGPGPADATVEQWRCSRSGAGITAVVGRERNGRVVVGVSEESLKSLRASEVAFDYGEINHSKEKRDEENCLGTLLCPDCTG